MCKSCVLLGYLPICCFMTVVCRCFMTVVSRCFMTVVCRCIMTVVCHHCRLEDFVEWMNGVEDTIADLEKESLSMQEYKDTLTKFEVAHCFSHQV